MRFGQSLREERERRGVTLETISAATKVSVRHLTALEMDADGDLPGGVFNRGFVQSYCRYLGLDEAAWLERYSSQHSHRDPDWSEFAEAVKRNRVPAEPLVRHRWWGVLAMFLALVALAWAAWHYVIGPRRVRTLPQPGAHTAGLTATSAAR